jgi:hypothetical protein
MDSRDRLILSLCALLRAERDTRAAFEAVIHSGQLSPEVLTAMLSDPVPAITEQDLLDAEAAMSAYRPVLRHDAHPRIPPRGA